MTTTEIELTRRLELMIETAWNLNFGYSQKRKSCPDNFIEMIDCISDKMYKQVIGVRL